MKILVAEDDPVSRRLLEVKLAKWGYEVVTARDGCEAWRILEAADAPQLAVLDWMMPGMDGIEVCRRVRKKTPGQYIYVILLTALDREADLVAGMEAGADDYMTKPFSSGELRVRLCAGIRILDMEYELLAARDAQKKLVDELQETLAKVKTLSGLIPICSGCKKIRDDKGYWKQLEIYISQHSNALFSHGYCPDCFAKAQAEVESMKREKRSE